MIETNESEGNYLLIVTIIFDIKFLWKLLRRSSYFHRLSVIRFVFGFDHKYFIEVSN